MRNQMPMIKKYQRPCALSSITCVMLLAAEALRPNSSADVSTPPGSSSSQKLAIAATTRLKGRSQRNRR
jgi:hypothetical protein